jgi:hypothetical protein
MLKKTNIFSLMSLALLLTLGVSGCGNSNSEKEASNENFTKAIQKHYDQSGKEGADSRACVRLSEYYFPIEIELDEFTRTQYDALFEVGLLTRSEGQVKRKSSSKMVPGLKYDVTEEGRKILVGGKNGRPVEFCFGHMKVSTIEKVEKLNDQDYSINYTYLVQDVPDWMKTPVVRAAFPDVVRQVDGPQPAEARVNLRSKGWRLYRNSTKNYTTSY